MFPLSPESIELIKIMANFDQEMPQKPIKFASIQKVESQIGEILRQYYRENTMGENNGSSKLLYNYGITEDEGKSAIACARRLGINIF